MNYFFEFFLAIFSGFAFGFLLRKAQVSQFDVIVGQFLLKDYTVMKVIFTAIVFGSIGIYSLKALGIIPDLLISSTPVLLSVYGGAIFALGMSLAGYCPGTAIVAVADGSKEMIVGFLGMLLGAIVFNELSFAITPLMEVKDAAFKQTIGSFFAVSNRLIIAVLVLCWIGFVNWRKRSERTFSVSKKNYI